MPVIEQASSAGAMHTAPDAAYEEVRQSFVRRLQGEQAHLAALAGALKIAASVSASAFVDLEMFAHRLRGAAAVFDVPELREAAKTLELTAAAAAIRCSPSGEPLVLRATQALDFLLTRLNGDTPSSAVAIGAVATN
jgi:HPt (histidine-containing phosphotransfer) domain-containing protein